MLCKIWLNYHVSLLSREITNITNSVWLHDNYRYYRDVYDHYHSFWTTDVGFLKLNTSGSAIAYLPWCSIPGPCSIISGRKCCHQSHLSQIHIFQLGHSTGGVQALALMFGAANQPLGSYMLVYFWGAYCIFEYFCSLFLRLFTHT